MDLAAAFAPLAALPKLLPLILAAGIAAGLLSGAVLFARVTLRETRERAEVMRHRLASMRRRT